MFHRSTSPQSSPLAIVRDGVYAAQTFEQVFDTDASKGQPDDAQGQAETKPHPLTVLTSTGADTTVTQESLMRVISLYQRHFAVTLEEVLAEGYTDPEDLTTFALFCARDVASTMGVDLHRLDNEAVSTLIKRFTPPDTQVDSEERHFWSVFTALLFMYFGEFSEPDWEPQSGDWPLDEAAWSMSVWHTPDDHVVCDLLVLMTPWDSDDEVWEHVASAMHLARRQFGDRLAGIRVIPPLTRYLSRWYHPDGTWEPLYEGVPNLDDLIQDALANGDAS